MARDVKISMGKECARVEHDGKVMGKGVGGAGVCGGWGRGDGDILQYTFCQWSEKISGWEGFGT